jgi:tripartite-type tricarboxylate transporter receptor subunit TctC
VHQSNAFYIVLVALSLLCGSAAAQTYPSKPIRIVLGFPPGTTPDIVTRILAEKMSEDLGQPLIVENRPGAGGTIATEAVARAPADGHMLNVDGCSAAGIVYAFLMTDRRPLDPFKDFTPVGRLMRDHWIVAVSPALGVNSFAELVALGKSKPGALTFPSPGAGSSPHLQAERLRMRAGFEATHVPYKDNSMPDLMAGRTSFTVQSSAAIASLIKSDKLKGLVVLSTERMAALPDVPTSAEAGMADLIYNAGICLYAPGGTPREVVMRLNAALNRAEKSDAVNSRFAQLGVESVQGSPDDTANYIRELMTLVDGLRTAVFGKAR